MQLKRRVTQSGEGSVLERDSDLSSSFKSLMAKARTVLDEITD